MSRIFSHRLKRLGGKNINACLTSSITRLFIKKIPVSKDKDEILKEFSKSVEGIQEVVIPVSNKMATHNLKRNGYALFEFGDHETAATAKAKLENSKTNVSIRYRRVPFMFRVRKGYNIILISG